MKTEVLNKLIELKKVSDSIYTNQLLKEFMNFDEEAYIIINKLIEDKIIERIIDEKVDICSFDTLKLNRLLKLKNLSD